MHALYLQFLYLPVAVMKCSQLTILYLNYCQQSTCYLQFQTTVDKNGYLTTLGGQSVLSNRYACLLLYFRQIAK